MNFDTTKIFIGRMDYFFVLLPGALFPYLLKGDVGQIALGDRYSKLGGTEAWATLLCGSYLLSFLIGSWLDEFYDWARRGTLNTQITLLARLNWSVFTGERNLAVDRAGKIKQHALGTLQAKDSINAFRR